MAGDGMAGRTTSVAAGGGATDPIVAPAILGAVLAGGGSRRMGGGDKWLLPLAGRPLIDHVIDRLGPQVAELILNANGDPARLRRYGLPVVVDTLPDRPGPLAGLLAALRHAERVGLAHVLTTAADTPFLPHDLAPRLSEALVATGVEIAIAASQGRLHPVVALVPARLADPLEAHLRAGGSRRVDAWLTRYAVVEVAFEGAPDPFFNINDPEGLAEAERLAASV